jgi:hypothetical protein
MSGTPGHASTLEALGRGVFLGAVGTMPDARFLLLASDLRARAEEVLTRAETFNHADARQKLRKIAETYVKLAERLEQRARNEDDV